MRINHTLPGVSRGLTGLADRLGILMCGFAGHHLVRRCEPGRICLQCLNCPYETPGWTFNERGRRASGLFNRI
jgi:hypothetical protein